MTDQQIEELVKRLQKEQQPTSFASIFKRFSWRGWIAMIVIIGSIGITVMAFYKAVPEVNEKLVYSAIGYILAKFGTIIDWNFGASKTDDDKSKVEAAKELDTSKPESNG